MKKKILVLTGSNSDIAKEGKPSALTESLIQAAANSDISFEIMACSADRVPFLLPETINREEPDGIIYAGSYSLVLGAGLHSALSYLHYSERIPSYEKEIHAFMNESHDSEYLPGHFDPNLVKMVPSKLFKKKNYIPNIAVPCPDTPSKGTSAFTSVSESPVGTEPRPIVGLERIDTAFRCMREMFSLLDQTEKKDPMIIYGDQESGEKLKNRLLSFGFENPQLTSTAAASGDFGIYVGSSFDELKYLDKEFDLLIHSPMKESYSGKWEEHLQNLSTLDHTVNLGVGNVDNVAILLTRLIGGKNQEKKMWKFRNDRTIKGVLSTPLEEACLKNTL